MGLSAAEGRGGWQIDLSASAPPGLQALDSESRFGFFSLQELSRAPHHRLASEHLCFIGGTAKVSERSSHAANPHSWNAK